MRIKSHKFFRFSVLLVLALTLFALFASPAGVNAQTIDTGDNGDKFVFGGRYRLQSGETIHGSLFVFGGTAILEDSSTVNGDVMLIGGTLESAAVINGNVNAMGGTVTLLDGAVINGDVNITSVSMNKSPSAVINGDISENVFDLDEVRFGNLPDNVTPPAQSAAKTWVDFMVKILWAGVRIFAASILAAVVVLLLPNPTERVARSIANQPIIASAFGLLTYIVAPIVLVLLTITILLIPVTIIVAFLLAVAGLFGWIAVGYEIGKRMEKGFKSVWAPAISAGLGTFVLTLVTSLVGAIPCVGWVIPVIVAMVGLGGVLISGFGTSIYDTAESAKPVVPPPQA
jgi:hypothetical protein